MSAGFQLSTRELARHRLILIYQMPKIGSQTIETTLREFAFPHQVLRLHYLSAAFARTLRKGLTTSRPDATWRQNVQLQLDSLRATSRALRWRRLLCYCGANIPKLEVITGVRELIGLMLASIFENVSYFAPNLESLTVEICRKVMLNPKTFKTLRNWFDLELRSFTGIDVFEEPFPVEQGYKLYENRFARVLVYRFEALSDLPVLLSKFLDWKIPQLVNCNVSDSKAYAQQYAHAREHLRLPPDLVNSLYETRMMRHFYSGDERLRFYDKWSESSSVHNPA